MPDASPFGSVSDQQPSSSSPEGGGCSTFKRGKMTPSNCPDPENWGFIEDLLPIMEELENQWPNTMGLASSSAYDRRVNAATLVINALNRLDKPMWVLRANIERAPRDERNTAESLFTDAELLLEGTDEADHTHDNDIMIDLLRRAMYLRLTEIAERQ